MYGEGQDRSARVRQIPINVEPRHTMNDGVRRSTRQHAAQNSNNNNGRQNQEDQWTREQQFDNNNSHSGYDQRQTSPNTSSININYRPNQAQRGQDNNFRVPRQPRSNRESKASPSDEDLSRRNENDQKIPPPLAREPSPNSDKRVHSPVPIPLPPPPEQQRFDHDDKESFSASPELNSSHNDRSGEPKEPMSEEESILSAIRAVKMDITRLLDSITKFDGISSASKEYRYLDEMLTRCVLNLDKIECGNSQDMRQQRRAAIKLVDQTTNILQRKLQINLEIHDLTESMSI